MLSVSESTPVSSNARRLQYLPNGLISSTPRKVIQNCKIPPSWALVAQFTPCLVDCRAELER
eukprot:15325996-Alexandrium_andersonii.AAC.1